MMNKSGVILKSLYRVLYAGMLACLCLFMWSVYFGIAKCSFRHIITALLVIVILTALNYLKLRGRIIVIVGIAGGFLITVLVTGFQDSILVIENYIKWLTSTGQWQEEWLVVYEIIQAFWVALFTYFFEVLSEKYVIIRRCTGGLILFALFFCLFTGRSLSHSSVVFSICFMALIYIEWIQSTWEKERSNDTKSYMLWIMPFVVIYLVLMCSMPVPEKAYEWKYVKRAYQYIVDTITVLTQEWARDGGEDFGIGMSGFSEEGILKGKIWDSNLEVMTIKGRRGLMTNVYLNGKVFDTFNGRSWEQNNQSTQQDRVLDTLETMYAVERYEGNFVRNYLYSTTVHLKYQYFKTGYLFAPLKSYSLKTRNQDIEYQTSGGNLLWKKRMGFDTEYDVQFYQMNVDHPEFYKFLEAKLEEDPDIWRSLRLSYKNPDGSVVEQAQIDAHRDNIYQNYLHEVTLSDEMKAYMSDITKDAQTQVDKLKAIEKALSAMEYTRSVGDIPGNVTQPGEFLDYFVLEQGKGYCTYFATAFILMAWEEGIPARYVQGFCIPMNQDKTILVTSSMAHAWPEVYIDGVGWIPFEPTPGYGEVRYTPWEMIEATLSDDSLLEGAGTGTHYWEEDNIPEPTTPPDMDLSMQPRRNYGQIAAIAGYTLLLIFIICMIIIMIDGLVGRYKYQRKSIAQKYRTQVNRNLRILYRLGYERKDAETLQEFRERALWMVGDDEKQETLLFIRYYEEILYGSRTATEEMLAQALEEREGLLRSLKEKKKNTYIFFRVEAYLLRYRA